MSEVALRIGGRTYRVACAAGEEERVRRLGATIADKLAALGNPTGPDAQNLLFAALMLADEVQEAREAGTAAGESQVAPKANDDAAETEREQHASQVADLEAEVARWRTAAQNSAEQIDLAHAREAEANRAIAAHEDEAARLQARLSKLEQASVSRSEGEQAGGLSDMAALAPALERFAEVLEECADKLERRAAGS